MSESLLLHIVPLIIGLAVSLWATPIVIRAAGARDWVDAPDERRKLHLRTIPNVGGLAIVAAFYTAVLALWVLAMLFTPDADIGNIIPPIPVLLGGLFVASAGFYDDLNGLGAIPKFSMQLLVSAAVVWGSFRITAIGNPISNVPFELPFWLSFVLTTLWLALTINAINLIDGLDGLAGSISVIGALGIGASNLILGYHAYFVFVPALVGAVVGFLRYNRSPASVFMGDTGSMFLGYLLGAYALVMPSRTGSLLSLVIPIVALAIPLADTCLAFVRRLSSGNHPFQADHAHIHHLIMKRLRTDHKATTRIMTVAASIYAGSAVFLALTRGIPYGNHIAAFFLLCLGIASLVFLVFLGYFQRALWSRSRETPGNAARPAPEILVKREVEANVGSKT